MPDLLHAWAVAPAAVGACCAAADRGRARTPELVASLLMLLAMLDAAWLNLLAPVYWAAALLAGAVALGALRAPRRLAVRTPHHPRDADGRTMTLHTATGMIAMAVLPLAMGSPSPAAAHEHGMSSSGLVVLVGAGSLVYVAASALLAVRAHRRVERAQLAAMGFAVALMAAGLLT